MIKMIAKYNLYTDYRDKIGLFDLIALKGLLNRFKRYLKELSL